MNEYDEIPFWKHSYVSGFDEKDTTHKELAKFFKDSKAPLSYPKACIVFEISVDNLLKAFLFNLNANMMLKNFWTSKLCSSTVKPRYTPIRWDKYFCFCAPRWEGRVSNLWVSGEDIFGMLNTFQKIKEEKSRFPTYFVQVMTIKTGVPLKKHVVHNGCSCIIHTIQSEMNIIDQILRFSSSQLREVFFFWEGRVSNFHSNIFIPQLHRPWWCI